MHSIAARVSFLLVAAACCCSTGAPTASADVYMDFGTSYPGLPSTYGAGYGLPGSWNSITATGLTSGLFDTTGATTLVSVLVTADTPTGSSGGGFGSDAMLLDDNFFSSAGSTWSVTVSGLADGTYDVYYYEASNVLVGTGAFTVNGTAATPLASGSEVVTFGDSYNVVTGVVVSGGVLSVTSTDLTGFRGLAGIQVVSAVPEPSSIALAGVALIAVRYRRRRCA